MAGAGWSLGWGMFLHEQMPPARRHRAAGPRYPEELGGRGMILRGQMPPGAGKGRRRRMRAAGRQGGTGGAPRPEGCVAERGDFWLPGWAAGARGEPMERGTADQPVSPGPEGAPGLPMRIRGAGQLSPTPVKPGRVRVLYRAAQSPGGVTPGTAAEKSLGCPRAFGVPAAAETGCGRVAARGGTWGRTQGPVGRAKAGTVGVSACDNRNVRRPPRQLPAQTDRLIASWGGSDGLRSRRVPDCRGGR